jgi:hypothetical protein
MSQLLVSLKNQTGPTFRSDAHARAISKSVRGFASDRALPFGGRMILSSNRTHFDGSCAARTNTLASLRGSIARIETSGDVRGLNKVALGHTAADALLRGGLATSAVHEVFAEGHQGAAATGFVAGHRGKDCHRESRWSGCGRILPKWNPARCR